jgi:hypothetical protein
VRPAGPNRSGNTHKNEKKQKSKHPLEEPNENE